MKKIILLIIISSVNVLYAQRNNLPPLKREAINLSVLQDQYNNQSNGRDYVNYKVFTSVPKKADKTISREYFLRDFNWDYIYKNNFNDSFKFYRLFFERMTVRRAVSGENEKCLYFESVIPVDSLTQNWCECCEENRTIRTYLTLNNSSDTILNYSTRSIFYDALINIETTLKDSGGKIIHIDEITFSIKPIKDKKNVSFIVGLCFGKFIPTENYSGSVSMKIDKLSSPRHETITQKMIGRKIKIGQEEYTVLEYKNGCIHLEGSLSNDLLRAHTLFEKKGKIYRKYDSFWTLPSEKYYAYRNNPNLSFEKFVETIAHTENPKENDRTVFLMNLKYDADTLYIVDKNSYESVSYGHKVSLIVKDNHLSIVPSED